jgi:RecJ-like exonuclease
MELEDNQARFLGKCEEAKRLAFSFSNPLIVHHYDADGIAAGAIIQSAFRLANRPCRARWIKKLGDAEIESLSGEKEVIFADLGGGNNRVNELNDVLIIDHHQTDGIAKFQINPLLDGIDGGTELSSSGSAYCVFRNDVEIAVVGAVGDMQYPLKGMNRWVLAEGEKEGRIRTEMDLCFYGRFSRTLLQFLAYSDDPFVPGVSYNEDGARKVLVETGIAEGDGERWRKYCDLSESEKKTLVSALANTLVQYNMAEKAASLIGESYVFPHKPVDSGTYEANEFSTMLNACGRHGKADIGVKVCMGNPEAMQDAGALLQLHRRMIREGIVFAHANIQDMGKFFFMDARGIIDEGIIGIVCGMALPPLAKKPVLGFSLGEDGGIKISGRGTKRLVAEGLNLGTLMKECGAATGGVGGGHRIAAGASIPKDGLNVFLSKAGGFFG